MIMMILMMMMMMTRIYQKEALFRMMIIQNDDFCSIGFDARLGTGKEIANALQTVGQAAGECYFLGVRWILFSRRVWEREGKPVSMDIHDHFCTFLFIVTSRLWCYI
jgi:hypothetical protein